MVERVGEVHLAVVSFHIGHKEKNLSTSSDLPTTSKS